MGIKNSKQEKQDEIRPILYKNQDTFFSFPETPKPGIINQVKPNSVVEEKKVSLLERRAKSSTSAVLSLPQLVKDSTSIIPSINSSSRPPRLNTKALIIKSPEVSPMSATSMNQAISLAELSQTLYKANYLPQWLANLASSSSPGDVRLALNKTYRIIGELEQQRIVESFQTGSYSRIIAEDPRNRLLNRYTDILPFDNNRVKLSGTDDYINASYLHSVDKSKVYIATQGPLPTTFADFWGMVWEQNSNVIVMLTNEEEKGRLKCHRYWPDLNTSQTFTRSHGNYIVENQRETRLDVFNIIVRDFKITNTELQTFRAIKHIHFLAWPDHHVSDPRSVLKVLDLANEYNQNPQIPLIVHCSAGCGRTAAFCTIDACLEMIRHEWQSDHLDEWDDLPKGDLVAYQVNQLRRDRIGSVQTANQFIFCYDAILTRLGDWYASGVQCTWAAQEKEQVRRFSWKLK